MTRANQLISVIVLFSGLAFAQRAAPPLSFEVADVQMSPPGGKPSFNFLPGGKLTVHSATMKELIMAAWGLREGYLSGGPAWLPTERYDIVAKAATVKSDDEIRLMLQTLLRERFKLEIHHEQKVMPVFELVVGKKGSKLKESAADDSSDSDCKIQRAQDRKDGQVLRGFGCKKTSMDDFAEALPDFAPGYIDLPVVNQTELKGVYDFMIEWTPRRGGTFRTAQSPAGGDAPATSDADGITIFDAVQNQLGLKLEPRKRSMDTIVVDKIERLPSDN